jgi:hypothetical protein
MTAHFIHSCPLKNHLQSVTFISVMKRPGPLDRASFYSLLVQPGQFLALYRSSWSFMLTVVQAGTDSVMKALAPMTQS